MKRTNVLNKADVARFLTGQRAVNRFVESERRGRLSRLTDVQSRREYGELCDVWAQSGKLEPQGESMEQTCRFLIERRRSFDKTAFRNHKR